MLVVRGHEDHRRHSIRANGAHDAKAIQFRHLHVEQHEIRAKLADALDGRASVAAFLHDLDITPILEESAKVIARNRLIVNHERP
jgi:hypothetical protein